MNGFKMWVFLIFLLIALMAVVSGTNVEAVNSEVNFNLSVTSTPNAVENTNIDNASAMTGSVADFLVAPVVPPSEIGGLKEGVDYITIGSISYRCGYVYQVTPPPYVDPQLLMTMMLKIKYCDPNLYGHMVSYEDNLATITAIPPDQLVTVSPNATPTPTPFMPMP